MKRLCKASVFMVLMLVVSITLTGCDMSKIGDFVSKIADVIIKIGQGIKSFGDKLGGGTGNASDTATVATDTATVASDTAVATTTTPVGSDTAVTPPEEDDDDEEEEPPATDDAVKQCAANRRLLMGAVEQYNAANPAMMARLDVGVLVAQGYLASEPKCKEGGTYVAASDMTGPKAGVACSKHGATEEGTGDTEADEEEESPGN